MKPLLSAKGIIKNFGETRALDNIDFNLYAGEIHGLVGANGSGKSTLLNILCGNEVIWETGGYEGQLFWQEDEVTLKSPVESRRLGIGMVHQELSLIGDLNVAANIRLGREAAFAWTECLFGRGLAYVNETENRKLAAFALERTGVPISPAEKTSGLSVNQKQFVEVAREISSDLKVLILDEPTACLGPDDAARLMGLLKDLKSEGMAILLVSHRLEELTDCCDRMTVFRDGKVSAEFNRNQFDLDAIALHMLGSSVEKTRRVERDLPDETVLMLENFVCGTQQIKTNFSLSVRKGEVLGLTGLAGHGHNLLPYGLMGLMPWKGKAEWAGVSIKQGQTDDLIREGIFFLPDERKELGLLLEESIQENMVFTARHVLGKFAHRLPLKWLNFPNHKAIKKYAESSVEALAIRCRDVGQPVRELSGGNQQKVCIARAIALLPSLLFVGEPTRGMDIKAKEIILDQLLNLNRCQGTTLVVASGELDELQRICDRIVVFHEGHVYGIYGSDATAHTLLQAMIGKPGGDHEDI